MLPQVLATIQATTEGPRRARAMSLYGATAGLSMVTGQILGGSWSPRTSRAPAGARCSW